MSVTAVNNQYAYLDREALFSHSHQQHSVEAQSSGTSTNEKTSSLSQSMFGEDGFGFDDFLDIINPLQHIPVISTLYREFTGDQIESGARIIGGGIFGGGIGLAASVVNAAIESETGQDLGGHIMDVVSSVTGIDNDTNVAEGEAVTISWNGARMEPKDLAEANSIQSVASNQTDTVINNALLLQLAAQKQPVAGLQLKAGITPVLSHAVKAAAVPTAATAGYEKAAELQQSIPASQIAVADSDFTYLDKQFDV